MLNPDMIIQKRKHLVITSKKNKHSNFLGIISAKSTIVQNPRITEKCLFACHYLIQRLQMGVISIPEGTSHHFRIQLVTLWIEGIAKSSTGNPMAEVLMFDWYFLEAHS